MNYLKILIFNDYAHIEGGAGKVAIESAIKLAEQGHEVIFFSAVGPVSPELAGGSLKRIICLNQNDILSSKNKLFSMFSATYNWQAVRSLKKLFSEWMPDIAHFHGVSKALSWGPVNTVFSFKIPIVYTLHDFGLLCANLGIYNFKTDKPCDYYKDGRAFKCMSTNCDKRSYGHKLWRWFRFLFTKNILKVNEKISGYIAVSDFVRNFFIDFLPSDKIIKVIRNPMKEIKPDTFKKKKKKNNIPVFLYVGRLSKEKGLDLLLEAFNGMEAELVIIGDGDMMRFCIDAAREIGRGKIKVMGWQDESVVINQMLESDVLILPSKVMETSGIVVREAAQYFLPSIVPDQGGVIEFVKDGVNGLYFETGNKKSLISAMGKFINDKSLSEKLGINARKTYEESADDSSSHTNKLENFYNDIIKSTKSGKS
jgi:glycosyltransferase involved in cell wall biosynthesis